jgi:hypothetical protein
VDQREWDYGARLPRESRAPESWSTSASPEDPEKSWGSVTDTGSLVPSPEAAAWAERAEAWAQRGPENEQGGQWSELAATGRPSFPADGVGWRTETAEWRATEQTARWRQTTEWRSTSGTHGWRSTTEAWQTGSGAEGFLPSVDPPVREQLAISGTAWPTPSDDEQPVEPVETGQVWQQAVDNPPAPNGSTQQVAWQRFGESTPPWQQEARPSWQQFAAPPAPWEQSSAASQPPWQPAPTERPRSWQTPTESPQSPPWQHLIEPSAPAGRPETPSWRPERPTWQSLAADPTGIVTPPHAGPTTYSSSRSGGFDDGRHLVREDDRAQWRRDAAAGVDPGEGTRQIGRRRAPEVGEARASGGTGWSTRSESDNWAGHADTGSMQMFDDPASNGTVWGRRREAPDDMPGWRTDSWRGEPDSSGWSRDESWRGSAETATPGWQESARGTARPSWQQDERGAPSRRWDDEDAHRRRPDERETPSWQREISATPSRRPDDDWRQDKRAAPDWRRDDRETPDWREDDRERKDWREDDRERKDWRREPPSDPWAQAAADTGVISAPWQQPTTDSGSWRTDTGPGERTRPSNPNRRRDDGIRPTGRRRGEMDSSALIPLDPEIWRREPGSRTDGANWPVEDEPDGNWPVEGEPDGNWPVEEHAPLDWRQQLRDEQRPVGEAATEIRQRIEPGAWQREERDAAAGGTTSYRGGTTGDWRQQLAVQNGDGLADGEARRFGTQDFVPFRPSGSAAVPTSASPPPANVNGSREDLLVGNTTGGRWQESVETQWPPRQLSGYQSAGDGTYERRPVGGSLASSSGRPNNLLEPDDDEMEDNTGGPLAAVGYTIIWYGVPVVLLVLYMLVLNGSQQAHALDTLLGAAPQFALSLALSMVVAVGLRWASGSWKAASVGLAAAVMGGGLATVLSSAITGNSLS